MKSNHRLLVVATASQKYDNRQRRQPHKLFYMLAGLSPLLLADKYSLIVAIYDLADAFRCLLDQDLSFLGVLYADTL